MFHNNHNVTSNGKTTPRVSTIDAIRTAITAPRRIKQANRDADLMKREREYKGMPNMNNGSVTEGFKARSLAHEARERTRARKPY